MIGGHNSIEASIARGRPCTRVALLRRSAAPIADSLWCFVLHTAGAGGAKEGDRQDAAFSVDRRSRIKCHGPQRVHALIKSSQSNSSREVAPGPRAAAVALSSIGPFPGTLPAELFACPRSATTSGACRERLRLLRDVCGSGWPPPRRARRGGAPRTRGSPGRGRGRPLLRPAGATGSRR